MENTNTLDNKTTSVQQPESLLKDKWIMVIQQLIDAGALEQAKLIDKQHNVGFFKKITKAIVYLNDFITQDPQMLEIKEQVLKLADPTINDAVLIIGESGTGKELLAKALHGDRIGNFVEINCAGLPESLIESELFGYEKGSFTGANKEGSKGLIEYASEDDKGNQAVGSLFLDEVGELPVGVQAKLLRVLQDKRIRKVGGLKHKAINFRIICATHQLIHKNTSFRKDLYHRISTFEIETTPLMARPKDIPLIAQSLVSPEEYKDPRFQALLASIKPTDLLGNVRSLQRLVRRWQVFEYNK